MFDIVEVFQNEGRDNLVAETERTLQDPTEYIHPTDGCFRRYWI